MSLYNYFSCFGYNNRRGETDGLSSNQTKFAIKIAKQLFLKEGFTDKNVVFSPFSLYTVLSIIAASSKGPTLNEFLVFLRSDSVDHLNSYNSQLVSALFSGM